MKPIGYYEVPTGRLLLNWARAIQNTQRHREELPLLLKTIHPNRPLGSLDKQGLDLLALNWSAPGLTAFSTAPTDLKRAIVSFLWHLFAANGMMGPPPSVIGYNDRVRQTISEGVDDVIASKVRMPKVSTLSNPETRIGAMCNVVAQIVDEIVTLERYRNVISQRLDRFGQHLAWELSVTRRDLTAAERTFFLEWATTMQAMVLAPAECNDPEVFETWAEYSSIVGHGPWHRYCTVSSTGATENPRILVSIAPRPIVYHFGILIPHGPFKLFRPGRSFELPWTEAALQEAAAERGMYFRLPTASGYLAPVLPPSFPLAGVGPAIMPTWDDDGVSIHMPPNPVNCCPADYSYMSQWRGRPVLRSVEGDSPSDYLIDRCRSAQRFGEGLVGDTDLSKWSLIDTETSNDYINGRQLFVEITSVQYRERIVFSRLDGQSPNMLGVADIDLTNKLFGAERVMAVPAFVESVLPPASWLDMPAPDWVNYALGRISPVLRASDRAVSLAAATISHNIAHIRWLLEAGLTGGVDAQGKQVDAIRGRLASRAFARRGLRLVTARYNKELPASSALIAVAPNPEEQLSQLDTTNVAPGAEFLTINPVT